MGQSWQTLLLPTNRKSYCWLSNDIFTFDIKGNGQGTILLLLQIYQKLNHVAFYHCQCICYLSSCHWSRTWISKWNFSHFFIMGKIKSRIHHIAATTPLQDTTPTITISAFILTFAPGILITRSVHGALKYEYRNKTWCWPDVPEWCSCDLYTNKKYILLTIYLYRILQQILDQSKHNYAHCITTILSLKLNTPNWLITY